MKARMKNLFMSGRLPMGARRRSRARAHVYRARRFCESLVTKKGARVKGLRSGGSFSGRASLSNRTVKRIIFQRRAVVHAPRRRAPRAGRVGAATNLRATGFLSFDVN